MIYGSICVLNAFLFYGLEVSNDAIGYLVRTILIVLDVLQFFVHQLLFVDFDGQVKHNQKAARKFAESNNMLGELLNNGGKEFIAVVTMYYQMWEFMVEVIDRKLKITKIAEW